MSASTLEPPVGATRAERIALRVSQLGAIAIVPAVAILHPFELDRFFVPKELALHLTAFFAALFASRSIARTGLTRVDALLVGYLAISIVSGAIATNPWLAIRAVAITASGLLIFWTARALREVGLARKIVGALAFATVLVAMTSLLQAYGVETTLFSENRAPGGTLGNRNFIAHAGACGFPLLLLVALRARNVFGLIAGSIGVAIVTASLVVTRSRAAWLAFTAVVVLFLFALLLTPSLRREWRTWRRIAFVLIFIAGGVAAAILIPNTLRWVSDDPYMDTVRRVADYQQGSGRGRLVQYTRSAAMTMTNPILGVGAGNWSVEYPAHAAGNDPSLDDSKPGMTLNPWPSSDWVAIVSERGAIAAALLALALLGMALSALNAARTAVGSEEGLAACALLGTLAGGVVTGLFDAVLLLGLPTLLFWMAVGALWPPSFANPSALQRSVRVVVLIVMIAGAAVGAARSAAQLVAMQIYATRSDRPSLEQAARIDPGNYRLRLRLARMGKRTERCVDAKAAHALFPSAKTAAAAARGCD